MSDRLPARLEATALMRQVEAQGGFAKVIQRGNETRGALALLIAQRGLLRALIERRMEADFAYRWTIVVTADEANTEKFRDSVNKLVQFDPDCWLIELDVADAERFIAETIASA